MEFKLNIKETWYHHSYRHGSEFCFDKEGKSYIDLSPYNWRWLRGHPYNDGILFINNIIYYFKEESKTIDINENITPTNIYSLNLFERIKYRCKYIYWWKL